MKKLKIMLLSLALFAIVGGALAFKAKFHDSFCTTDAYFDASGYYCSYSVDDGGGFQTTTATCGSAVIEGIKTLNTGPRKVCTTTSDNGCLNVTCPSSTSVVTDGI